jgi:hypothetical protein
MTSEELARRLAAIADDKKATDISRSTCGAGRVPTAW